MSANRIIYSRFSPLARLMMGTVGVTLFLVFAGYLRACLTPPPVPASRYDRQRAAARQSLRQNRSQPSLSEQVRAQSEAGIVQMKWVSLGLLGIPSLVLSLFNLYFVGPNHTAFDFARRQVICVAGFPLVGRDRTSDFTDIEGLRLTGGKYQNPSVVLVWKQPQRPVTLLQSFPNERAAREMMRALSSKLNVSEEA